MIRDRGLKLRDYQELTIKNKYFAKLLHHLHKDLTILDVQIHNSSKFYVSFWFF